MPSDSDLRRRFQEGTQPRSEIDVDAVLRRARARRRPRVVLAGASSVLAIAAIAVPAVVVTGLPGTGAGDQVLSAGDAAAPESAGGASGTSETQLTDPAAKILNLCGADVTQPVAAATGVTVTIDPVTASPGQRGIPVTVTLTNTGESSIFGSTAAAPTLTLSRDGVTVWHTGEAADGSARVVDLGPGESMTYQTSFDAVICGPGDDAALASPTTLPSAPAGTYLLWAMIDLTHDDGSAVDLVSGPAVAVTLR
ncbi:MAG: hypothetical protein ACTHKX_04330 [Pseudolysinimonas sp.]